MAVLISTATRGTKKMLKEIKWYFIKKKYKIKEEDPTKVVVKYDPEWWKPTTLKIKVRLHFSKISNLINQ